ncbi:MAG: hypothetical protein ACREPM_03015 [Gemmatimonadaceae bacterium]
MARDERDGDGSDRAHGPKTKKVPTAAEIGEFGGGRHRICGPDYGSEVRVYTVIGHQQNYVAKAMAGELRTFVLDPNLFPNDDISFEARPTDGTPPRTLGPYKVNKGETVDIEVPPIFTDIHASVHRSM